MSLDIQHIDELLAKYFAGEALPEEAMFIDDWKAVSYENQSYFTNAQHIFNIKFKKVDERKLFSEIIKEANNINSTKEPKRFSIGLSWLKVAALFLFISIGVVVYFKLSKPKPEADTTIVANGESQSKTLADGTLVTLNKNATLTLIGAFNNKQRKLKLIGEAFFEVIHNEESPFIIEVGDLEIKDIGTAFNVKALPQNDTVFVVVTEGI
ncbi:MAG: FecR domain-containing protein, partial [Bacteroidia bacterium]|nr:FecR domain-containing protein [Bacteroidia bacterium]